MSTNVLYSQGDVRMTASSIIVNGERGKLNFANPTPGTDEVQGKIAMWGSNNLLPHELVNEIEITGVLSAGLDGKSRICLGKGPQLMKKVGVDKDGHEILEYVNEAEIEDWLDMNNAYEYSYATMYDLFSMGNAFTQVLLSPDRTRLDFFKRQDPTMCRFEKMDTKGGINNVYMSGDWAQFDANGSKTEHTDIVPMLDRGYPYLDLVNRKSGNSFMLALQYPLIGRNYYSRAGWTAARKWTKIAQGVPEMKEAMFNNQISIKYLVEIHSKFWHSFSPKYAAATDKQKAEIQDDFYKQIDELLVGGKNAYKALFSTMVYDDQLGKMVSGINITAIDDKIKDGKLLPDSAAANIEILLALIFNPCLLGVDMPGGAAYGGGAGSGSNIREAFLAQVMICEVERRINSKVFDIQKRLRNWDRAYVLRYPNQILTTTDTGANTEPTV